MSKTSDEILLHEALNDALRAAWLAGLDAAIQWLERASDDKTHSEAERRNFAYAGRNIVAVFPRSITLAADAIVRNIDRVAPLEAENSRMREALRLFRIAKASAAADNWDGVDPVCAAMFEEADALAATTIQPPIDAAFDNISRNILK